MPPQTRITAMIMATIIFCVNPPGIGVNGVATVSCTLSAMLVVFVL